MPDEREMAWDAMDWLLDRFERDDAVAYAEVGGIYSERTDAVVGEDGPRERLGFTESGVWFRVFADGAADYRYTTSLDEESLEDEAERAIRGGEMLAQEAPGQYDAYTTHRASHSGWAADGIDTVDLDTKIATIEDAIESAGAPALGRVRAEYADAHIEEALCTTTGSTVQTTLDRAQVRCVIDPDDGPKISRHAGSTDGPPFLERLPALFEAATADAQALAAADVADVSVGPTTLALSPRAAGQLFHLFSHYLEADTDEMGFSPYSVGDQIGPDGLTIEDGVRAGSWASSAYDAELRPSTPTRLVRNGEIERFLHNTTTAAEVETYPAGNSVRSLGFDQPPRIHARHLAVESGEASDADIRRGAAVYVERFGQPWLLDEVERAQRTGFFPPSAGYAKNVAREAGERPERGTVELPLAEAYRLEDGTRAGRVENASLAYGPELFEGVSALGAAKATVTGVCNKHKSRLPYAVTAPGVRLEAELTR